MVILWYFPYNNALFGLVIYTVYIYINVYLLYIYVMTPGFQIGNCLFCGLELLQLLAFPQGEDYSCDRSDVEMESHSTMRIAVCPSEGRN